MRQGERRLRRSKVERVGSGEWSAARAACARGWCCGVGAAEAVLVASR
jgi:hypothetical protein